MTGPLQRPEPRIVSATSRPPLRFEGWPVWGWTTLALAAIATLVCESYALFWLSFGVSSNFPPPDDVASARDAARDLSLEVIAPWTLAAILLRPHLRVVVTALACASPAVWFWWEVSRMT